MLQILSHLEKQVGVEAELIKQWMRRLDRKATEDIIHMMEFENMPRHIDTSIAVVRP